MAVEYCVHCGEYKPAGGYCWESPNGQHSFAIDEETPDPDNCCPLCGAELDQAQLDGFAEHVCDPADLAAQKEAEEAEEEDE